MLQLQETPGIINIPQVHEAKPVKAHTPNILIKAQVPVDEQHPVVNELLGLGYELEECIQAVELFPEDSVAAQEYLLEIGEKGELFKGLLKDNSTGHTDIGTSFKKLSLEQQESSESGTHGERCVKTLRLYRIS